MQRIGGMAADTVGRFVGTQLYQFSVYGLIVGFYGRYGPFRKM